ncbi:MAG: penicillin-binding protein [Chlamydiae bacterium RIFCSPHIGHO2_12_FULL_49_9]|nr:MAG: penicillin-binding protein [Chlamydiae bacterium RIFCSPHIGHO2_12_FULL_49_9]
MNSQPVGSPERKRLVIIAVFLSVLFCFLIIRFYYIQIVEGEKWTKVALAQHQYVATVPFMRGSFYSNTEVKRGHPGEDQPFVVDVPKFHLFIDPDSIPEGCKKKMVEQMSHLLQTPKEKLIFEFYRKSRSRKIASWLSREQRQKVEQWWSELIKTEKVVRNGIFFLSDYQRSYPFGTMLGPVLHTVQGDKDPETGQSLPTGGLEMLFNSYLRGKQGKRLIVRSPRHPLDTGKILEAPENGADIYLTINHYLQAIAETELAKGVKTANAKGGWAVMMDPRTGEILALAQMPPFDPSRYADYFNDPSLQERTRVRAVTDCFEPGSIFKPITMAICLKANEELKAKGKKPIFDPDEKIPTVNGWFPGRSTPLKDGRTHAFLNMEMGLQKSSNIYMARIAQRLVETMGDQWYRSALSDLFGFGKKTQIDLPAESGGLVPTPGKLHPNGKLEWSLPTPYSLAIGHNILINSIQIVRAYAIIANGGYDVQPHLVRKIVKKKEDGSQQILVDNTAYRGGKPILSSQITKRIVRGLKYITKEGGTSKRADISGYTEAGKSGTSEKIVDGIYSKDHHISSFLGFAPADNPRFVLLISLDDPEKKFIPGVGKHQHGGVCAAPIFKEIATRSLQYLGVAPDDPYGYPPGDPRRDANRADWTLQVQKLKELYESWNR